MTPPGDVRSGPRWRMDIPLGLVDADRALGGTAAPLLAGFALASAVVLVTAEREPPMSAPALGGFAVAAMLHLFAIQFGHTGLLYSAGPADRLAWLPDPADEEQIARAQVVQHRDSELAGRYRRRSRLCYDLGVLAMMTGLALACVPARWTTTAVVTLGVLGLAIAVELVWIVGGRVGYLRPRWLLPGYRVAPPAAPLDPDANDPERPIPDTDSG